MELYKNYLCSNHSSILDGERLEDIYFLLVQILSLPHTIDEVINIFNYLTPTRFEYYPSLDISRALALTCQDVDTRLLEKMLSSKHHWIPHFSYYYPYINTSSMQILLHHNKICLDETTFQHAFLGRGDLLRFLLERNFNELGCQRQTSEIGSWEWVSTIVTKYPMTHGNLDILVDMYGPEILPKQYRRDE